jgi:hypothetical protein
MNLVRRSGAPSTFAWLLGLVLGATCATTTACSATSGSQGGGWLAQSGGGPLGNGESSGGGSSGGTNGTSSGAGFDAGAPSSSGATGDDGGMASGEAAAGDDGGLSLSIDGAADAPAADAPSDAPAIPTPPDFTLVNTAVTGVVDGAPVAGFDPIVEGATIDLTKTGTLLSVRLNPALGAVIGSVGFALDATYTHTENTAPYFLCSDDGAGTISSCATILLPGKHTLSATPYSGATLTGTAGTPVTLDFTIVDATDAGGQ